MPRSPELPASPPYPRSDFEVRRTQIGQAAERADAHGRNGWSLDRLEILTSVEPPVERGGYDGRELLADIDEKLRVFFVARYVHVACLICWPGSWFGFPGLMPQLRDGLNGRMPCVASSGRTWR
jgi:hypothetical protein